MNTFAWPDQWHQIKPEGQIALERELLREISPGHKLFGLTIHAIARRADCDDVLFAVGGSSQVAEVHLVYGKRESNSDWPAVVLYESLIAWRKEQTGA